MRILVLGGYGLIGMAVVRRLSGAGHQVVGLGRDVGRAQRVCPQAGWINADIAGLTTPEGWAPIHAAAKADAIVNAAGVLQDGARDDVVRVQSTAMQALYRAARPAGVARFVQISAMRATGDASTAFMRTKGEADAALRASDLEWTILKPGLVLAPQAYGGTALLRGLAAFPFVQPLTLADRPVQTVSVADVARAVQISVEGAVPARGDYDLVEDNAHTLGEIVGRMRAWLGLADARALALPGWSARLVSAIADGLGWLGWRSPFRSTAMAEIAAGVTGDPGPWRAASGSGLASLDESLRAMPATVQERWFARLFLMKPLVIGVLSLFWIVSGLVTLRAPEAAADVLTARGVGSGVAMGIAIVGAVVDLVLGVGVLVRRVMAQAAIGMIAVTLAYLAGATWVAPDLWADPLGPLVKAIPAMVLAGVVLAMAEDR